MNKNFHFSFLDQTNLYYPPCKVYEIKSQLQISRTINLQGLYKICLITGKSIIHYANKVTETEGPSLFFGNVSTPYQWKFISGEPIGYACVFTEELLKMFDYFNTLQQSSLFESNNFLVFSLNQEQKTFITSIFIQMLLEQNTQFIFKDELIHNWMALIMHEALKMKTLKPILSMEPYPM